MSLSRAQSIFTFVECARTATLSLNLRQLRLASWIPRGALAGQAELRLVKNAASAQTGFLSAAAPLK